MHDPFTIGTVAHIIQLAVAPVFLLTAIGTLLTVLTNRLCRVIDRSRILEARLEHVPPENVAALHTELVTLSIRAKLIDHAITLCTIAALLVCAVIATLFLGDYMHMDITIAVALLFIISMLSLVLALLTFLREIFIGTANLRIGPH